MLTVSYKINMDKNEIIEIMDVFSKKNLNKLIIKKNEFVLEMEKEKQEYRSVDIKEEEIVLEDALAKEIKGYEVKSPLVGVYYEAASPESEAFVKLGDYVEKGEIICILEAMKMINEIKAPISGTINKINFQNEDLVQYDDVIMEIKEDV